MEQYSVEAILSAVDKGFSHTIDQVNNKLSMLDKNSSKAESSNKRFGSSFSTLALATAAGSFITKVTGDIGSLIKESVTASDAMDKFKSTMQFAGLDNSAIEKAAAAAKKYADDTVYDLGDITNTTAQLAANGIKDYIGLTEAAGNLNAVAGGNANTFKSVAQVMTQTAGAGKLTSENWRQLSDAIPGASGKLQEALLKNGAYTGDFRKAMEKGQISAEEFNQAILDLGMTDVAREAATSTKTIEGAIGNMQAGIVTSVNKIIDAIGKDNITNAITSIGEAISKGLDFIAEYLPKAISFFKDLKDTVVTLAPVLVGVGASLGALKLMSIVSEAGSFIKMIKSIVTSTKLWTAAQEALNLVQKASPIGLIIAGITALVAIIVYLWNTNEGFRNAVITIWNNIKKVIVGAWEAIKTAWSVVVEFFSGLWDGIKAGVQVVVDWIVSVWNGLITTLSTIWNTIKSAVSNAWQFICDSIMTVVQQFTDNFMSYWASIETGLQAVWDGVKMIFQGAWDFIKSIVLGAVLIVMDLVTGNFETLKSDMQTIWDAIKNAVSLVWESIKSIITGLITIIVSTAKTMWENFKSGLISIWETIKNAASSTWNWIKTTVFNLINGLVNAATNTWQNFKNTLNTIVESIKSFINNGWQNIKNTVINIVNGLVDGAERAWETLKNSVSKTVQSVKNFFGRLREINLWDAGKAIIDGFLSGIKSAFEGVKKFVGGIADWIRNHKGPISYDRKLLIPAGNSIMEGFNKGLNNGFRDTMSQISGITGTLQSSFDVNNNKAVEYYSNDQSKQPVEIRFSLGDKIFGGLVEDINNKNSQLIQINELYSL